MDHKQTASRRLALAALCTVSAAAALSAHGGNASAQAGAHRTNSSTARGNGGYALAPALMGAGASQPGALPNASLTLNLGSEVTTADPQVLSVSNEVAIAALVFSPLLTLNAHNQVAANAAERMAVSDDGRTYTFTLRPGMTYSDGTPVTAYDYAYAIARACSSVVNGLYSNILFAIRGCQAWRTADLSKTPQATLTALERTVDDAIKATGPRTLRIWLQRPAGYFPYVMTTWVTYPVRRDLAEHGGATWWKNPSNYIGNGPFKLVSWTPRQQWVFARNNRYFRGKPGLARIVYREVTNSQTALLAYRQGAFDMVGVPATQLPGVQQDATLASQLHRQVAPTTSFIAFDNADPPFNKLAVRQAFAAALNRRQYVERLNNGVGRPAGTLLYPGIAGYQTAVRQVYDPAKARRLLAQARYPNGRGFPTLQLPYFADDPAFKERATFWAAQIKQVLNVEVQPTPMDGTQLTALIGKRSPELKLYVYGWIQDYPHPQDWLSLVFGNDSPLAPRGWNDAHFNALVNQADMLPIGEATPLYRQADAYLARQAPVAFYTHGEALELIKPNVRGYVRYPTDPFDVIYQPEKIYETQ